MAFIPHEPMHGSLHLFDTQAKWDGQSWWITHSGLQFGGVPNIPIKHEHTALVSCTRQSEFGPHGDGIQGLDGTTGFRAVKGMQKSFAWNILLQI